MNKLKHPSQEWDLEEIFIKKLNYQKQIHIYN